MVVVCDVGSKKRRDNIDTQVPNTTYTLNNLDGFYKAINNDYRIDKDWIKFGDNDVKITNGCQFVDDIRECQRENDNWFRNYPQATSDIKAFNPKGRGWQIVRQITRFCSITSTCCGPFAS